MTSAIAAHSELMPTRPIRVGAGGETRTLRVGVVVPCFNRRADAAQVLRDLVAVERRWSGGALDIRVVLVDNGSDVSLSDLEERGVWIEHLRLGANTGGSGGYNAGMSRVVAESAGDWARFDAEYVWLVDSDARVGPETLSALIEVMERDAGIVAAGSAIADPLTGQVFEIGGMINRRDGQFEPCVNGGVGVGLASESGVRARVIECEYVATCCAMVRAEAVRACGGMPDRFLNADDVEWCIRMRQRTGGRVVGVPWSVAMHPRFDRYPTWTRYYMTRNALGPVRAIGLSKRVRRKRLVREAFRAAQQAIVGRHDLAQLHLAGLSDAASGQTSGAAAPGLIRFEGGRPVKELRAFIEGAYSRVGRSPWRRIVVTRGLVDDASLDVAGMAGCLNLDVRVVDEQAPVWRVIAGAAWRWVKGPMAEVAIVPARGRPSSLWWGRQTVQVASGTFVARPCSRIGDPARAVQTFLRGALLARRAANRDEDRPLALDVAAAADRARRCGASSATLDIIVLSFNRWSAVEKTVSALLEDADVQRGMTGETWTITVVDNGSTDGTPGRLRDRFPAVRVVQLSENIGVEAFNQGARQSTAEFVLILDDDATPAPGTLAIAMNRLERDRSLAAVTLHPMNPRTRQSEWPFAQIGQVTSSWPVMGCANLVRRSDWLAVGGYEREYFLYRNDMDLALTLLDAGRGVHFDPALVAWHDSPNGPGDSKSVRWHRVATRNWVWMARRHGRGMKMATGAVLGWMRAHAAAGLSAARQWATFTGGMEGVLRRPPCVKGSMGRGQGRGTAWARYLRLRLRGCIED